MKYFIVLFITVCLFTSCKKDVNACSTYTQISGRETGITSSEIRLKPLRDTLSKYPQLVVYRTQSDQYVNSITCHVYYQDLLIFSDEYGLYQSAGADTLSDFGTKVITPLSISLEPSVNYKDAIKKAKNYVNFDHTCISYQLGLYNVNKWYNLPPNYKLAWKIMDSQKSYIYVIVDAVTNNFILSENGIRWVN